MPVIGLPKVLENSLNTILDDLSVSSWNMKGDDGSMQVWIRFRTDVDTQTALNNTNITYRKVPPSQVNRNRDRASNWQNKQTEKITDHTMDNEFENDHNKEMPPSHTGSALNKNQDCETQTNIDHNNSAFGQPSPLPGQVDGLQDERIQVEVSTQEPSSVDTTLDQHSTAQDCKVSPPECKQYGSSRRKQSSGRRMRPFWYKNVHVDLKCSRCKRDYINNTPSETYFCTRCPSFICVHCIDNGHHIYHQSTLKGPASLKRIYDYYEYYGS